MKKACIKKGILLLQMSDFSLGRGFHLIKAFDNIIDQDNIIIYIITNPPIYLRQSLNKNLSKRYIIKYINLPFFIRNIYFTILGRLLFYVIFSIKAFLILLHLPKNIKLILSRGPHPFTDIISLLYKELISKNTLVVSDITDLWPYVIKYLKINSILKYFLISIGHRINMILYNKLDKIITLNHMMKTYLQNFVNKQIYVIYGIIDLNFFREIDKRHSYKILISNIPYFSKKLKEIYGKFVILYAGIMSPFQDPSILIKIAKMMKECKDIVFLLVGTGPLKEKIKKEIQINNLDNVVLLNPIDYKSMPFLYSIADICIIPPPSYNKPEFYKYFSITLPKKFIEYSASAKPILCITPPCVASELCLKWEAGYHILPHNVKEALNIIEVLRKNDKLRKCKGNNARKMAVALFSIKRTEKYLHQLFIHEYKRIFK